MLCTSCAVLEKVHSTLGNLCFNKNSMYTILNNLLSHAITKEMTLVLIQPILRHLHPFPLTAWPRLVPHFHSLLYSHLG
jgi:hypothetical protein